MSVEQDLFERLTSYSNLVSLIDTRVYAVDAPQGITDPYCVYTFVSSGKRYSHGGYSGLRRSRVQISCYAETYELAKEVVAQATAAMESWPQENVNVQAALSENEADYYEDATGLYHVPVDFFVWYKG